MAVGWSVLARGARRACNFKRRLGNYLEELRKKCFRRVCTVAL